MGRQQAARIARVVDRLAPLDTPRHNLDLSASSWSLLRRAAGLPWTEVSLAFIVVSNRAEDSFCPRHASSSMRSPQKKPHGLGSLCDEIVGCRAAVLCCRVPATRRARDTSVLRFIVSSDVLSFFVIYLLQNSLRDSLRVVVDPDIDVVAVTGSVLAFGMSVAQ